MKVVLVKENVTHFWIVDIDKENLNHDMKIKEDPNSF